MNYPFAPSPTFGISEHAFATWENGFSDEELDRIIACGDAQEQCKGTIGGALPEECIVDTRESSVAWLAYTNSTAWLYDRMAWIARQLNGQFYKFDLHGFCENMQFTVYTGDACGHYTWHTDAGMSNGFPPRKLSLVLQLSQPEDYEGGDLQVYTAKEPTTVVKRRGVIAAFPSYVLHRVTPVTAGVRKTLVVWTCGPAFK